jgi:hypothetical protein
MAALKSGATLRGTANMSRQFALLNDRMKKMAPEAVQEYGHIIIEEAKALTPVDTGQLRDSGYVSEPDTSPNGRYTTVTIGFGATDPTSEYALIQHENTEYYHRVGQSHYLIDAITTSVERGRRYILGRMASILGT